MPDGNVFRRESKRWVAPKTSYDGEDWGNDYDEYDGYGEIAEESETEQEPPLPQQRQPYSYEQSHEKSKSSPTDRKAEETTSTLDPQKNNKARDVPIERKAVPERERIESSGQDTAQSTKDKDSDRLSSLKKANMEESPSVSDDVHKEELKTDHDRANTDDQTGSANDDSSQNDEEDSSIQDIYGFYENRYSHHPYSVMANLHSHGLANDFSDSTASLSTGIHSVDSTAIAERAERGHDGRASTDYQSGLNQVPEASAETSVETPTENPVEASTEAPSKAPADIAAKPEKEADFTSKVSHLHIRKHSRDASSETAKLDQETTQDESQKDTVFKQPSKAESRHDTSDGDLSQAGDVSRYSQLVDPDIAELYRGSSELLKRPISTYQASLTSREISDKSIRELLTPMLEINEFDDSATGQNSNIPSLFVTSASPERQGLGSSGHNREASSSETMHSIDYGSRSDLAMRDNYLAHESGYVDGPSEVDLGNDNSDSNSESDDGVEEKDDAEVTQENESEDAKDSISNEEAPSSEPFMLPSERNRLQQAASNPSIDTAKDESSSNVQTETPSDVASDSASESVRVSENHDTDTLSDIHKIPSHQESHHARELSEMSADSSATGVTTSSVSELKNIASPKASIETSSADAPSTTGSSDKASTEVTEEPRSVSSQSAKTVHPIAAKVKRPPQVDFAALFGHTDLSSEARNKQIQQLRVREVEYSTGLETWLMATLETIDKNAQVYTNGVPPSGDPHSLELPATAKMSNVVHSSATNTKEKLGKVGTKSKSFFAKVIR